MREIFLVLGFDVGGNSGNTVERAFERLEDAEAFALRSKNRKWNNAFGGSGRGHPFDVETIDLVASLDEIADQLNPEAAATNRESRET